MHAARVALILAWTHVFPAAAAFAQEPATKRTEPRLIASLPPSGAGPEKDRIVDVRFSDDGELLTVATAEGKVTTWSLRRRAPTGIHRLPGLVGEAVTLGDGFAVYGGAQGAVLKCALGSAAEPETLVPGLDTPNLQVRALTASGDSRRCVAERSVGPGSEEDRVWIDLADPAANAPIEPVNPIVALSRDGSVGVWSDFEGRIEAMAGRPFPPVTSPLGRPPAALSVDDTGGWVAAALGLLAGPAESILVFSTGAREERWLLDTGVDVDGGPASGRQAVAMCGGDGLRVAFVNADRLLVWDLCEGRRVTELVVKNAELDGVHPSGDGVLLALTQRDGGVRVVDLSPVLRDAGRFPDAGGLPLGASARVGDPLLRHAGEPCCAAFGPDGSVFAVADRQGHVVVRDAADGSVLVDARLPWGVPTSLAWSSESGHLLVGAGDREGGGLFVLDPSAGKLFELGGTQSAVEAVQSSEDGSRAAVGTADGTVFLLDLAAFQVVGRPVKQVSTRLLKSGIDVRVASIAFRGAQDRVVSLGMDGSLFAWDLSAGARIPTPLDDEAAAALAFSPSTGRVALRTGQDVLRIGELSSGRVAHECRGSPRPFPEGMGRQPDPCAFSSDGSLVVWGRDEDRALVWRPGKGDARELAGTADGRPFFRSVAVSPDGSSVVTTTSSGCVLVHDGSTGALRLSPSGNRGFLVAVDVDSAGTRVVSGDLHGGVVVRSLPDGAVRMDRRVADHSIRDVCLDPGGRFVAALTQAPSAEHSAPRLTVWSVAEASVLLEADLGEERATAMALSTAGRRAAVATRRGVTVWTVADGPKGVDIAMDGAVVRPGAMEFSASGDRLVLGTGDALLLIRLPEGRIESRTSVGPGSPDCVRFSGEETGVVAATRDGEILRWDGKTGAVARERFACPGGADRIRLDRSASVVVSTRRNGVLRSTRRCDERVLVSVVAGRTDADRLEFELSDDGRRLVTAERDGTLLLWDFSTP